MSVIDLKPHSLSFLVSLPGYEDDNGDWHNGTEEWSEPLECHAVPAGRANQLSYEDGTVATYTFTVGRLDKDCREFQIGEKVKLNCLGKEYLLTVKGFHRYQLQSKLWL